MSITAVQIKLNSIQEYIFTSNKLSENIGASNITDQKVFYDTMKKVLEGQFNSNSEFIPSATSEINKVSTNSKVFNDFIKDSEKYLYSILDIGGGGAIVLFNESSKGESPSDKFKHAFSKQLLLNYPGLKYSFSTITEYDLDNIKKGDKSDDLNKSKHWYHSVSTIPKHGVTQDCPLNNDAAELFTDDVLKFKRQFGYNQNKGFSKSASVKLRASDEVYSDILNLLSSHNLVFSDDISKLGQKKEGSYIAVVHIDGNGVGNFINSSKTAFEFWQNSIKTQVCTRDAIKKLIEVDIIAKIENGIYANELELDRKGAQYIIPFRPLLGGGDDITFICEGRIGMYLAEKFVSYYVGNGSIIKSACAGVSIVKTKFPFYKAYKLAEELCAEAKVLSRKPDNKDHSFISFYCAADSFAGSLEQIRARTQVYKKNELYQGPYDILETTATNSLNKLKAGIKHFSDKSHIPNNKIQKLRELLIGSDVSKKAFLKELKELEHTLPGNTIDELKTDLSKLNKYFDQIELLDFYLEKL